MKFLLVVFFLLDGQWVQGEGHGNFHPSTGWGVMPYDTEEACLISKAHAENIHKKLKIVQPHIIEKYFECIAKLNG